MTDHGDWLGDALMRGIGGLEEIEGGLEETSASGRSAAPTAKRPRRRPTTHIAPSPAPITGPRGPDAQASLPGCST